MRVSLFRGRTAAGRMQLDFSKGLRDSDRRVGWRRSGAGPKAFLGKFDEKVSPVGPRRDAACNRPRKRHLPQMRSYLPLGNVVSFSRTALNVVSRPFSRPHFRHPTPTNPLLDPFEIPFSSIFVAPPAFLCVFRTDDERVEEERTGNVGYLDRRSVPRVGAEDGKSRSQGGQTSRDAALFMRETQGRYVTRSAFDPDVPATTTEQTSSVQMADCTFEEVSRACARPGKTGRSSGGGCASREIGLRAIAIERHRYDCPLFARTYE
ncbi:hypothetical protein KM043_003937 [Ampulex compressa]|nr:hypothetical protein KM043_003937 [Ampulex compressa]